MTKKRTTTFIASVGLTLFAVGGCGGASAPKPQYMDNKPKFTVTGRVAVDGASYERINIEFVPAEKALLGDAFATAHAVTDAEGKFTAMTYKDGDGVNSGEYVLLFDWAGPPGSLPLEFVPGRSPNDGPLVTDPTAARLNEKYGRSNIRAKLVIVKVEDGKPTDLGTIELTTR